MLCFGVVFFRKSRYKCRDRHEKIFISNFSKTPNAKYPPCLQEQSLLTRFNVKLKKNGQKIKNPQLSMSEMSKKTSIQSGIETVSLLFES